MRKFELGDKVQLSTRSHKWHVDHLVQVFTRPTAYNRFEKQNYEEIAVLIGSKARRTKLKGLVTGHGNEDCVRVCFQWKDLCAEFYCDPNDLKKL